MNPLATYDSLAVGEEIVTKCQMEGVGSISSLISWNISPHQRSRDGQSIVYYTFRTI
jgi:hypothetical protein